MKHIRKNLITIIATLSQCKDEFGATWHSKVANLLGDGHFFHKLTWRHHSYLFQAMKKGLQNRHVRYISAIKKLGKQIKIQPKEGGHESRIYAITLIIKWKSKLLDHTHSDHHP